jgi:hypothetical protein
LIQTTCAATLTHRLLSLIDETLHSDDPFTVLSVVHWTYRLHPPPGTLIGHFSESIDAVFLKVIATENPFLRTSSCSKVSETITTQWTAILVEDPVDLWKVVVVDSARRIQVAELEIPSTL